MTLDAANDIVLKSAESTTDTHSDNKSSGWSAGIGFSLGANTGITVAASVNKAKGNTDGTTLTHENTDVTASGTLTIRSGGDVTAIGAVLKGDSVKADIGGGLTLTSEQDADNYRGKQTSVGAGASFTFGSMTGSGGVNASVSKTDSEYKSVVEQTGIMAGAGGFDITVGGNTALNGAVIASAAGGASNSLNTGTLSFSDIENKAAYQATTAGFSASTSGGVRPVLAPPSSDSASGTTKAAIGDGSIVVRSDTAAGTDSLVGLSRDTAAANGSIEKIFDQQKVEEMQELGQVFGEQAFRAVGDIAKSYTKPYEDAELQKATGESYLALKDKEADGTLSASEQTTLARMEDGGRGYNSELAQQQINSAVATLNDPQVQADYENWKEGSANKILLHGVAGGLQAALAGGSIGAGALGAGSNEAVKDLTKDLSPEMQQWAATVVGAGAGALVGGGAGAAAGGATALDGELFNRQLHEDEKKRIQVLANGDKAKELALSQAACALVKCSAEFALGSAEYIQMKAYEDAGNSPALAAERFALQQQYGSNGMPLFSYSVQMVGGDGTIDAIKRVDNTYNLTTRFLGGLQALNGVAGVATGTVMTTTGGAGCVPTAGLSCAVAVAGVGLTAFSYDQGKTGFGTLINGTPTSTFGAQLLQQVLGVSPDAAEMWYGIAGFVPLGVQGVFVNSIAKAANVPKVLPAIADIYVDASNIVKTRVDDLLAQIPENSRGRITMGVAVVEDAEGVRSVLISTSEPRGYLRPGITLQPGEVIVPGAGHAEADIVAFAESKGLKIVDIGATRPVCTNCQAVILPTNANITTTLKKTEKGKIE